MRSADARQIRHGWDAAVRSSVDEQIIRSHVDASETKLTVADARHQPGDEKRPSRGTARKIFEVLKKQ
ncbi:hypothetical protein Aduo_002625 [Ancylostoma duodenale]